MTQKELSERSGLEQTHISKIERGASAQPEKETLQMLAFGLGVVPERLYVAAYGGRDATVAMVPVKFYGRVPADESRWVAAEEGAKMEGVLPQWLGTRSPDDFFIVEASGDCLFTSDGIRSGNYVLLERVINNRIQIRDGEIVLVRIGDEYSLKRWFDVFDVIELRDGNDAVKFSMAKQSDFTVLGRYVTHWHNP